MAYFSNTDIARILRIPARKLIHLAETGVVRPDGGDVAGRGSWRRYSRHNVFEILLADRLVNLGWPYARLVRMMRVLRAFLEACPEEGRAGIETGQLPCYLHVWDDRFAAVSPHRALPRVSRGSQRSRQQVFELLPDGGFRGAAGVDDPEANAIIAIRVDLARLMRQVVEFERAALG